MFTRFWKGICDWGRRCEMSRLGRPRRAVSRLSGFVVACQQVSQPTHLQTDRVGVRSHRSTVAAEELESRLLLTVEFHMLALIYANVQLEKASGTLGAAAIDAISSGVQSDAPALINQLLGDQVQLRVHVEVIDRPLDNLYWDGSHYQWATEASIAPELDQFTKSGWYDNVSVFHGLSGQYAPTAWWGGGGLARYDMSISSFAINPNTTNSLSGSGIIHEFMHGLESQYFWERHLSQGLDPEGGALDLHDAEEFGYTNAQEGRPDWVLWYRDFLTDHIKNYNANGVDTGLGFGPDAWAMGLPHESVPYDAGSPLERPDVSGVAPSYLSDVYWSSAKTSTGSIVRDKTVNNTAIKINGVTYNKGVGISSDGRIQLNLNGRASRFQTDIGIDDDIATTSGSVIFKISGDGRLLYQSAVLTGASNAVRVDIDVTNVNQLSLEVEDAGDGTANDHAVWANAVFQPFAGTYLSDIAWTTSSNGWGRIELDKSVDRNTLIIGGIPYGKGIGMHANGSITIPLNGKYSIFQSDIGVDDETNQWGTVTFSVYTDGRLAYSSGTVTGNDAAKSLQVDVSGVRELKLVVTDAGDGDYADHAVWAGAFLATAAPTAPSKVMLGAIGAGVAANDVAQGLGYLMYSATNVKTRFSGLNPGNAQNFVTVQYDNGQWQYANNDVWVSFTPAASDRLIARLDYTSDSVVMLKNQFSITNGIQQGYLDTDLVVTPNVYSGVSNAGEFGLSGTFIDFAARTTLSGMNAGVAANDAATGAGYMMYSRQVLAQRFKNYPSGSATNFVAVQYNGGQWQYANNDAWVSFTPVESDRLVAQLDYSNDTATLLKAQFARIQGIDQGYLDGDIAMTPNIYGGSVNKGEFTMTGSYLVFIPSGTGTSANWAPTQLTLSKSAVAENQPSGMVVGLLSANDPEGSALSYSLVAGTGSTNNAMFQIVGNQLQTKALFDYEAKSSDSIRVRVVDKGGLTYEKAFTITVTNVFDSPVGSLRSGVTGNDAATGVGYLMYSEQSVLSRFAGAISSGQSDNFVAVQLFGGQWKYANNDAWINFTPVSSDRLVAQLDYTQDAVTLLKGVFSVVNGIQQGYVNSNLKVTPNVFAGVANPGEFRVEVSFIEFAPPVSVGNLRSGVAGNDAATGIGYLLFSTQSFRTRFPNLTASNADQFLAVQYLNGGWFYANNDSWVSFTPAATDRLIAQLDFTNDTVTMLRGATGNISGIRRGYLDSNVVITPNRFGGVTNSGEFGLAGTQIILGS